MCSLPAAHQLCEGGGCVSLVTRDSPRAAVVLPPSKYLTAPCEVVPRAACSHLDAAPISKAKGQEFHVLSHVVFLKTPTNQRSAVHLSPGVGWAGGLGSGWGDRARGAQAVLRPSGPCSVSGCWVRSEGAPAAGDSVGNGTVKLPLPPLSRALVLSFPGRGQRPSSRKQIPCLL